MQKKIFSSHLFSLFPRIEEFKTNMLWNIYPLLCVHVWVSQPSPVLGTYIAATIPKTLIVWHISLNQSFHSMSYMNVCISSMNVCISRRTDESISSGIHRFRDGPLARGGSSAVGLLAIYFIRNHYKVACVNIFKQTLHMEYLNRGMCTRKLVPLPWRKWQNRFWFSGSFLVQ